MELFDAVEAIRGCRDNKKVTKHNHLFAGMFRCANCKQAMIPERQKGRVYYRCHLRTCPVKTVREDMIEEDVKSYLTQYLLSGDEVERLKASVDDWLEKPEQQRARQIAQLELPKVDQKLSRLTDKLIDGVIDDEAFQAKRGDLLKEQKRLQEASDISARIEAKRHTFMKYLELAKSLVFQYENGDRAEKRELLKITTSNREIDGKNLVLEPSNMVRTVAEHR